MQFKRIVKIASYSFLVIAPIGVIAGFAKAWNAPESINIAGSSAVQPLMTALGNDYKNADVTIQAGGSSEGMKVAATLEKDLGNASKNTYSSVQKATIANNSYDREVWKNNGIKTVTFAWDGLAVVYKPSNPNSNLIINKTNIYDIYALFSGIKTYTLSDLLNKNDSNNEPNIIMTPYARTGGASASGTATSFLEESSLTTEEGWQEWGEKNQLDPTQVKRALSTGRYLGSHVVNTNESNVESWNRVSSDNRVGSIVYLSLGFVEKNLSVIQSRGFRIAKMEVEQKENGKQNKTEIVDATIANVSNGTYLWSSPLNTMISTVHATQATKDFLWWILTSEEAKQLIQNAGYAIVTDEKKVKMISEKDFGKDKKWKEIDQKTFFDFRNSDVTMYENNDPKNNWYGVPK
ncbi:PstS family phosphate ABC transporter substrate-binding protein [Malacoplasma iowae]|uniref:PstS family phosphate ABC transporter substrate-binding protein n=1 Tax=Malacoplasma iowae TaxID=2116 RepID=UPI002A186FB3|nr:substrate-binding domain-containing protein [Malacoplasma iowae]WPL39464.1 substrate-binding domain-containing protein [Malacoplasma iowae]